MSSLPGDKNKLAATGAKISNNSSESSPRRTHDTLATLANSLEPENIYTPGYVKGTDSKETTDNMFVSDVSKTSLETTADYAARLTQGEISHQSQRNINKSNVFAIDDNLDLQEEGPLVISTSTPVANAASQIKRNRKTLGTFLDASRQFNSMQANRFNNVSRSDYGAPENSENPFFEDPAVLDKESGRDGHILLPSIEGNERPSTVGAPAVFSDRSLENLPLVQQKISTVLKTNRFNPSNKTPFMRDNERVTEEINGKTYVRTGATKQGILGKYIKDAEFILESDLKSVGGQITDAATGQSDISKYADENGAIGLDGLRAAMRLTGWQLVKSNQMRPAKSSAAENILADSAGVKTNILTDAEDSDNTSSYGALNSTNEPFAGPMPLSMVFNTIIGLGSLVVFAGLLASIGIIRRPDEDEDVLAGSGVVPIKTKPKDMAMGRHALKSSTVQDYFLKMFRIPVVENQFDLALAAGILAFYGLEELPSLFAKPSARSIVDAAIDNISLNVLDKFRDITNSAGYYSVITRAAARDVKQITKAFSEFKGLSAAGTFVQVFKVVDAIVESTTWKFLMTLAAMGDKIISSLDGHPTIGGDVEPSDTRAPSERYSSNRDLQGRISWRHSSLPSNYILPKNFKKANDLAKSAGFDIKSINENTDDNIKFLESNRLSRTIVNLIENRLNAEYMPFYFHDIRTNEIIGLHAFLTGLSDDYAAEYASTSAYGRGDDIKIYNKTARTITIKFIVAATSREDLDIMYWNINKLVSMVYPQWSRGRSVVNGTGPSAEKFIQPFSQIPTASPLIRIRLGDVLTSNYSKFGLMRLFGLGESDDVFTLHKGPAEISKDKQAKYEADKEAAELNLLRAKAFRKVDPGAPDNVQIQTLNAELPGHDATDALVADNTQFGYKEGDLINISPSGDANGSGYWPRDNTGKLGKKFRKSSKENRVKKFLINYGSHTPEVEIVKRVPDGADPRRQNENHFENHVPASDIKAEKERDTAATKAGQNYFGTMAYLVKILPGSIEDSFSDAKKIPKSLRYHRITHSMIKGLSPAGIKKITENIPQPEADVRKTDPKRLADFFDSKNNYIVRSFESAMGRGLAGFITGLNIDWKLNEATWELDEGARAPKHLEINVNFSPIHDIPLGLDSEGMMRSVAYNVGDYSRSIGQDSMPSKPEEVLSESGLLNLEDQASKSAAAGEVSSENEKKSSNIEAASKQIKDANKANDTISSVRGAASSFGVG